MMLSQIILITLDAIRPPINAQIDKCLKPRRLELVHWNIKNIRNPFELSTYFQVLALQRCSYFSPEIRVEPMALQRWDEALQCCLSQPRKRARDPTDGSSELVQPVRVWEVWFNLF
ncbi:uncharacterized protein LOC120074953 [Benincasa hispida]|uniref:uncharacterized protein LOC120074953 n=1 Tax=Benincasa hispida TaxID=102211 RepID=UPI001901C5A8|nr:uncharacterized protein LOC120074953 [Benincasa hispida]